MDYVTHDAKALAATLHDGRWGHWGFIASIPTWAQSYQHVTTSARPHFGVVMSPCPQRVPARMATSVVLEVVQCQSAIAEYADSDWLIASWQLIWQL